ncbi:MAG: hypothetical protein ACLFNN_03280 [Candidatus Paceibacterota bacterium]
MFPFSKKILAFILIPILLIIIGSFFYVQLLLGDMERGETNNTSKEEQVYNCREDIEDEEDAMDCFRDFFKESASLEFQMKDKEVKINSAEDLEEAEVYLYGEKFLVIKKGNVQPYFIKDGYVFYGSD